MKILRVINSLGIGGAERSIANNVPLHIDNGFEMDVLLLNGKDTFFLNQLKEQKVGVFNLGVNNSVYNPLLIFKLIPFLKKYELIHVHLFPSLYWVAFAKILVRSSVKLVFTEHSTSNRRRSNPIMRWMDKIVYRQYDKIIAISDATAENLERDLQLGHKTVIIDNGVDISGLRGMRRDLEDSLRKKLLDKKVIVQIAGFRKSKDQDTVIRALSALPDNYILILVGGGERMEICKQLSESLSVQERVLFMGIQENIAPFLNIADIVVMSSHWEGFGRTAVEGMAMGKPVIATNVVGLSDVVRGAGLLFERGDDSSLVKNIKQLAENEELYRAVSEACLLRAKKYDVHIMVKKYEELYRALILDGNYKTNCVE